MEKSSEKCSTGLAFLDTFLAGGWEQDVVTTIFGPPAAGKTTLALLSALAIAKTKKKVLYVDTEGGIAAERLRQLCQGEESPLERIFFFHLANFQEQQDFFTKLHQQISDHVGLIVIDSISNQYRVERDAHDLQDTNAALGRQLAYLVQIARQKKIPSLLTNQVYADFQKPQSVRMVGGDLMQYGSKCLIELQKLPIGRQAIIRKHRSLPEGKTVKFQIVEEGMKEMI